MKVSLQDFYRPDERIFNIPGVPANFYHHQQAQPITSDTTALYSKAYSEIVKQMADNKRTTKFSRILDLGCGNGVILLTLAKDFFYFYYTGVDIVPDLIDIAKKNFDIMSELIGVRLKSRFMVANYAEPLEEIYDNSCDLILSNPPYFPPNTGRESPYAIKSVGRMESAAGQYDLLKCVKTYLSQEGSALIIYPTTRRVEFEQNCGRLSLQIKECYSNDDPRDPLSISDRLIFHIAHA